MLWVTCGSCSFKYEVVEGDDYKPCPWCHDQDLVHDWFGLSYSSYLVVPRTMLQSMPADWQAEFVRMVREMTNKFGDQCDADEYNVYAFKDGKRLDPDPLANYDRGRRRLESNGP